MIGGESKPVHFPSTLPPQFFVAQGHRLRNRPLDSIAAQVAIDRLNFRQGGRWHAQRLEGEFFHEWVDYATLAIGLYAAAAGLSMRDILTIQNLYARLFSTFPAAEMDRTYTNLAKRNVVNTEIGFRLYREGPFDQVPEQHRARWHSRTASPSQSRRAAGCAGC